MASQNPLAQADKPHQLFADAPPTQINAFDPAMMMAGGIPPPPTMPPPGRFSQANSLMYLCVYYIILRWSNTKNIILLSLMLSDCSFTMLLCELP